MKDVGGTGSDRHVGTLTGCFTHFNAVCKKKTQLCIISSSLRPEMHTKKELRI